MSSTQSTKLPQHEASENFSKISDLTVNPLQHVPLTKYDGGAIKQVDLAAQPAVDELKWDEVPVPKSHEHDVTSQASGVQDAKLKAGEKWEQAKVGANDLLETGKEKAAEISAIAGQKFEQTKDSLRTATTSSSTTTSTGPSTSDKLKSKAADVQESAIAAKDASVSKMTAVKDDMMDKAAQLQKSASDKTADLKQSANEKAAVVGAKATELKDASVVKATELKDASAAKATELKNTTSEKSVAAKDSTVSGLQSAKESTISNLQYAKDVTTEKLVAAKDLVTEKVAQTKETTMQAVQQLQAKTSEQLENVKAKVTELTHKASTPTSSSTSTTTTTTESAPSTTSNLIAQGQNIVQDLTHKATDLMHMGVDKTTAAFHTVSEKMGLAGASNTNSAAASDLKEIAELAKGGNASVVAGSSETLSTHTTVRSTTEFDTPQGVTRTDEFKEFKDGKLVDASAKTLKADKPAL